MAKSEDDNVVADNTGGGGGGGGSDNGKKKEAAKNMASVTETLSFVFSSGPRSVVIWCVGMIAAVGNGAVRRRRRRS